MAETETEKERLDRELIELLNEIRVALPGIQVLFAFLLLLPFQQTFRENQGDVERAAYFVALLAALAATVFLIAPTTFHRIRFRERDKLALITISNRLVLAASVVSRHLVDRLDISRHRHPVRTGDRRADRGHRRSVHTRVLVRHPARPEAAGQRRHGRRVGDCAQLPRDAHPAAVRAAAALVAGGNSAAAPARDGGLPRPRPRRPGERRP